MTTWRSWFNVWLRCIRAERRATINTPRICSTAPSRHFGEVLADPDRAARAAASASIGSDFPNRRRICRFGRSTSTTTIPSLWRYRVKPTPYDPVPSTPTRTIGPNAASQAVSSS
jgi:hypothetical protein